PGPAAEELTELLRLRDDVGAELAAVAAGPARAAGLPVLVHAGVSPRTVGSRSPLTPALARLADAVVVSTDARPEDAAARDLAGAVAAAGDECAVLASVRAFPPDVRSRDELTRRLRDAAATGATGARVHTFGLIPDERLEWIGSVAAW
ncbi:hypothetical protein, partial [Jiangella rhizosphaerae]|uniref:hypothetical protein n=1 Tax=Jiangella rhizosphaerae TaxID=2293569 RepID=UPI0018F3FD0C